MILGAQFFTLREFCKTLEGLDETMKKVADMGYTAIHLSGVCPYEAEWVAERAKAYGLKIAITHFDFKKIINDTEATIEFHKKMDCKYIGFGGSPALLLKYDEFLSQVTAATEKIAEAGLRFSYHNHDTEFARCPESGKIYLDDLCDHFTPDKMAITMDTYWVQAGGGDPAYWIEKLKGRTPCVHFKDMVGYFEVDANGKPTRTHRIAPLGEGNIISR